MLQYPMKKDITTKETIKTITQDISKYILHLDVTDIKFIDKELQRIEKREADIVALCKVDGIESILHLEIQNSNDKSMSKRMLRYYTDIKMRYDNLPIHQYLIYIGKPKLSMKENIDELNLNFRYNIIDMHKIDCEEFIKLDTPEALVLSILCDFKGKNELDMLIYITKRLEELTKDSDYKLGKYMLILETLSTNRDLQNKLKEAEEMLRDIKYEELPSYEIGMERGIARGFTNGISEGLSQGISQGLSQGLSQGIINTAIKMITKFKLSVEDVAKELNISIDELKKHLDKK